MTAMLKRCVLPVTACAVLLLWTTVAAQDPSTPEAEIQALARRGVPVAGKGGLVIGLLDANGVRRVVPVADVPYDGRTIFEIGSITKTFTGILLAEMAERGELRLEDPVQDLLPKGVSVPARNGRQIRLVDLATHTSGLPRLPGNLAPADSANPYADYSVDRLYDFLRGHQLGRDIGERAEYSNLGAGLLGHVLALRAGKSYEALVTERILAPLGMTSTRITLSAEHRGRLAPGHSASGQEVPNWDIPTLAGAGALRSDVDDMLKFIAASLQPPDNALGRAIRSSHEPRAVMSETAKVGLHWIVTTTRFGRTVIWHNGGTAGYRTFIGFDPERRTGVVVLSNRSNSVDRIGMHLLDPRMPVSVASLVTGFHVLPLCLAGLLVAATFVAFRRTGATTPRAAIAACVMTLGLAIWMAGTYFVAASGWLRFDTRPPTFMLMVLALVVVSVGLGVSSAGRRLAIGLPLWVLVASQSFRLPLELLMHEAYEAGLMPVQMSFSGLNYDILTGASAVVVAILVAFGRAGRRAVLAWNIVGTLLLCNIVVIALLSTPTPLRVFRTPPANTWVATAPYVWLPAVMVAFAVVGHIVIFRRLRVGEVESAGRPLNVAASMGNGRS
jgi:D-alanyl-D-alanine-carboxypeptidase/D-alanyl-D-alanine-endopeptidase